MLWETCIKPMEILDRSADVRKIDASVRDKFKWEWLEAKNDSGNFFSDYMQKLNGGGKALCTTCDIVISYGSSGKKAFTKHGKSKSHMVSLRSFCFASSGPEIITHLLFFRR